jgi:hypothetical protein
MKNLLPQKEKYLINFANDIYDIYRKQRYGIRSCSKSGNLWLDEIRKDIVIYQSNYDSEVILTTDNSCSGCLPCSSC